jgi:hypothetical protein
MAEWWRAVIVRGLLGLAVVAVAAYFLGRLGWLYSPWWSFVIQMAGVYIGIVLGSLLRRRLTRPPLPTVAVLLLLAGGIVVGVTAGLLVGLASR